MDFIPELAAYLSNSGITDVLVAVALVAVSGGIAFLITEIVGDNMSSDDQRIFALTREVAISLVVKAMHLTPAEKERAELAKETYLELADEDIRLIYVAIELEQFINDNTGLNLNMVQVKALAERFYQDIKEVYN